MSKKDKKVKKKCCGKVEKKGKFCKKCPCLDDSGSCNKNKKSKHK